MTALKKQFLLPIPNLLTGWRQVSGTRWSRFNSLEVERFTVYLHNTAWFTSYPLLRTSYQPEDIIRERLGFPSLQSAQDYLDRAAKNQSFIFQE